MNDDALNRADPARGRLMAWRGHALLLADGDGNLGSETGGFYFHRTRFLTSLRLLVDGDPPDTISAHAVNSNSLIVYRLAKLPPQSAEPAGEGGKETAHKAIVLTETLRVYDGVRYELRVASHALRPTTITLAWHVDADFADLDEAKSGKREQTAPVACTWSGDQLSFRYAHPQLRHATALRFAGADFSCAGAMVRCSLTLNPGESRRIEIRVEPQFAAAEIELPPSISDRASLDHGWAEGCATLQTSNRIVQAAWDRAVADLASLHLYEGEDDEGFTFAAGVPNYLGLFGRDSLMASLHASLLNPRALRGTLRLLRRSIARTCDDRYDAQPGRVLHQRMLGPLAILGKTPFLHYYGDYSAPGLFLLGLAWDYAQTGDADFFHAMEPDATRVLAWMDRDGDADGDGFYEYQTRARQGLKNQGWKDSQEAILYPDGRMVPDPIAVAEIQALYFAAKQALALALSGCGDHARATRLLDEAAALRQRFNERYWMNEEKFLALALDPDKRPVRSIASNACECLAYGIVDADKAGPVVERLMAPEMFSDWGIRTLSSRHPAYNPFGYHLGAVWPCTAAMAARGFKRYGAVAALHRLAEALFSATRLFHYNRLPEVFGGQPRDPEHPHPGLYPGACAPQAWSASAIVSTIASLTGVVPLAPLGTLIVDPELPAWLPELTLRNLTVGRTRASLRFCRNGAGRTEFEVLEGGDQLHVFRPSWADDSACFDRLSAAIRIAAHARQPVRQCQSTPASPGHDERRPPPG